MATTGRISDYDDELLAAPEDDDLLDISVLVSTGPNVWLSTKMRYAEIKATSTAIGNDIIPVGNAAGDGIEASTGKAGGLGSGDFYLANENFFTGGGYGLWQGEFGDTQLNADTGNIVVVSINNNPKITVRDGLGAGVTMALGPDIVSIGAGTISAGSGARLHVAGLSITDSTDAFTVSNLTGAANYIFKIRDDGMFFTQNGTGINEFSTDGTLSGNSDDALPTEKAVKSYVDANSTGGWLGSETRIKIAPWDIVSYNDKDGVSIQDDGGVVNDAAAKITTMVTGVFIPTGYRAVNFRLNASANIAVELFESQIDDSTAVSKGSGNANSQISITNVDSTTTNYLNIIIVEAGNDIYGGYITIQKI